MKKETKKILVGLLIIATLLVILSVIFVSIVPSKLTGALTINPENTENPLGIGINPEEVATNPESAANQSLNYLREQWSLMISKTPIIGEVHLFFLAHQTAFKLLFNMEYSFSLTFICVLFLWLFTMTLTADFISWAKLSRFGINIAIGALLAIILARVGAYTGLVNSVLLLIYEQSLWWVRLLVWILIIAIACVSYYGMHELGILIRGAKAGAEAKEIKENVEQFRKFKEGLKEGQKVGTKWKEAQRGTNKFSKVLD